MNIAGLRVLRHCKEEVQVGSGDAIEPGAAEKSAVHVHVKALQAMLSAIQVVMSVEIERRPMAVDAVA